MLKPGEHIRGDAFSGGKGQPDTTARDPRKWAADKPKDVHRGLCNDTAPPRHAPPGKENQMSVTHFIRDSILDLTKAGPRFLFQGLRSHRRSASTRRIDIRGVGGLSIRPGDSDFQTLRQVFRNQDYQIVIESVARRVRARYDAILAAGRRPVIVDAGANIGAAARWFRQQYPDAAVVAIEPDPANVTMLRTNVADTDIHVLDAAIGSEAGFATLLHNGGSWAVQTERASSGMRIVTVDQAIADIPAGELFIVKIDIEGFESDLFASNTEWIDQAFVIYVEPHDWLFPGEGTSRPFQRELGRRDFELFIRGENLIYVR